MEDANRDGHIRHNRGESTSSNTRPATGESAGKHQKRYVDFLKSESKTYLIHGPGNYSDKCKVLGEFGDKYTNSKPTKGNGNHPIPKKHFNSQLENNNIINNFVDDVLIN